MTTSGHSHAKEILIQQRHQYQIRFPSTNTQSLQQDQVYFYLRENDEEVQLRFHDYGEIYNRPGLYEQVFYDRLKCNSPRKAYEIMCKVLRDNRCELSELRFLDLGAGNGMVGELFDVARAVGIDISPEASKACERDRPSAYDAYYIADLCALDPTVEEELRGWQLDSMTCIAALGFGDIPAKAFATAFNLIQIGGWICFNVKETFLHESDKTGFSHMVKHLLVTDTLEVHHLERYRHRVSIDGQPLFYYMLVGRKQIDISEKIIIESGCA